MLLKHEAAPAFTASPSFQHDEIVLVEWVILAASPCDTITAESCPIAAFTAHGLGRPGVRTDAVGTWAVEAADP